MAHAPVVICMLHAPTTMCVCQCTKHCSGPVALLWSCCSVPSAIESFQGLPEEFSKLEELDLQGPEGVLAPGQRFALPALHPVQLLEAKEASQLLSGDIPDEGGGHDVGVHQVMEQLVAPSVVHGCREEDAVDDKAVE